MASTTKGTMLLHCFTLALSCACGPVAEHGELKTPDAEILDAGTDRAMDAPPDAPPCGAEDWCPVSTPTAGVDINGIWAASPTDVWIVGSPDTLLHWDGAHFNSMKTHTLQS